MDFKRELLKKMLAYDGEEKIAEETVLLDAQIINSVEGIFLEKLFFWITQEKNDSKIKKIGEALNCQQRNSIFNAFIHFVCQSEEEKDSLYNLNLLWKF